MYVIDPHPLAPDPSPYAGRVWQLGYSKFRQAKTFAERIAYASNVSTEGVFDEVLADDLQPAHEPPSARRLAPLGSRGGRSGEIGGRSGSSTNSNEMWCSWGPAPNAAWLIAANGSVLLAQSWFDADEMNATLRRL